METAAPSIVCLSALLTLIGSYCTEKDICEWKVTLQNIGRKLIMDFFLFVCESYKIRF